MITTKNIHETGITGTVLTLFSDYSLLNLIEIICEKKIRSIVTWLTHKNISPGNCLIIGSYLTGIRLANHLCVSGPVTVLDIYPQLSGFFHPDVKFVLNRNDIINEQFDMIINTSGLGGITNTELAELKPPKIFVAEDPCSDGSDEYTRNISKCVSRFKDISACNCGIINTGGLMAKTSGTMTLTMEIIKKSMRDVDEKEGVLYSSSYLDFFERILFKDNNPELFFTKLLSPALVVSTLKVLDINCIIEKYLDCINSRMIDMAG